MPLLILRIQYRKAYGVVTARSVIIWCASSVRLYQDEHLGNVPEQGKDYLASHHLSDFVELLFQYII